IRARLEKAAERKAKAHEALVAAKQSGDQDVIGVAEASVEVTQNEYDSLRELRDAALSQAAGAPDTFGATLENNPEARPMPRGLAGSSAQIRGTVPIGPLLSMEAPLQLTGRSLRAAPISLPDPGTPGRDGGFLGIAATPVAPTSLLDLFASVPFEGRK